MRFLLVTTLLLLTECSSASEQREAKLMNEIETTIKLPAGAEPLREYSRYYAYGQKGEVLGIYAGKYLDRSDGREWVKDPKHLPMIMDGGCGVVNVRFDIRSKKIEAYCNGEA
jgi:hypothetical protein